MRPSRVDFILGRKVLHQAVKIRLERPPRIVFSMTEFLLIIALGLFILGSWSRNDGFYRPDNAPKASLRADSMALDTNISFIDSSRAVPSLDRFLEFVEASKTSGGLIHNYINDGLHHLALALRGISDLNALRISPLEKMHVAMLRYADSLQADPLAALQVSRVRPAFLMAVEIMGTLNMEYDSDSRGCIRHAREAVDGLIESESTLHQRLQVQEFFFRTSRALLVLKAKAESGPEGYPSAPPEN